MKRYLFLFSLLLVTSCTPSTPTPIRVNATQTYEYQVLAYQTNVAEAFKAFEVSSQCPKICWLGIQPETTTTEDALNLLMASDRVAHGSELHISDSQIKTIWFTNKTVGPSVSVTFENGLVRSIYFVKLKGFRVDDFINLLGEPSEISIHQDEQMPIVYTLYFPSFKTDLYVSTGFNSLGPAPDDSIEILSINIEFDDDLPSWRADDYENRQPWLGYGHLDEYLPEVESTSSP